MALGCAFILLVIIWLYRRHQRKQQAKRAAAQYAMGPGAKKERTGWRWKLLRFGEKLFCHARSRRVPMGRGEAEDVKLTTQLRMTEEARPVASDFWFNGMEGSSGEGRREEDLVQLIGSYNDPLPGSYYTNNRNARVLADRRSFSDDSSSQHSELSMYSQVTGLPHNVPEPRQPLKSRFSMSTFATKEVQKKSLSGKKAFWK